MANANEILDQAIRRLNELVPATPVHWTRPELLVFLNEGMSELNLITADYQRTVGVAVNNTANVWDLPAGVIAPLSVRLEDRYLRREAIEHLDKEMRWEASDAVRLNAKTWCPLGLYKVIVAPRTIGARTLNVEVLQEHPQVADAAVPIPLRPEYERALEDYVVGRALFKEGGAEFQQGLVCYNRFLDVVQQLSGRNILRSYPAWDVQPETKTSETTLRESVEPTAKEGSS